MSTPHTFTEFGVPEPLVTALDKQRITEPFEIQQLVLSDALAGGDILGRAPTGSGKTLAFGLPMLARVGRGSTRRPRGLILSPTRELAEQITVELAPLAATVDRRVLAVYGGNGIQRQITALRRGIDVLVACPGRLLDLIDQGAVDLGDVEVAVVDEADRMADMGFLPDVRRLLDQTNVERQTMLFSATLDNDVKVLIDRYQRNPIEYVVAEPEPDLSTLHHRFVKVDKRDRVWLAADLITDLGSSIVFVRTRHGADRVARQLRQAGVKTSRIHGGRSQGQRDQALRSFAEGQTQALVATDVAARGIHVDGVAGVIHYDPPAEHKDYVHRSGRTGRAGAGGVVVSLLAPDQVSESVKMQRALGIDGEIEPTPERVHNLEPVAASERQKGKPSSRSKSTRSRPTRSRSARSRSGRSGSKDSRSARPGSNHSGSKGAPSESGSSRAEGSPRTKQSGKPAGKQQAKPRSARQDGETRSARQDGETRSARQNGETRSVRQNGETRSARQSPAGKPTSGAKSKADTQRPKSKRSGKPRPKNRKNRPKQSTKGRRRAGQSTRS
jgi:superfamily II DNA/RNA helicase